MARIHSLRRVGGQRPVSGREAAFTLIELLVVISIVGVLVALLLPAVQSVRESARRMHCQSNLKQLSLGVLNYESSHHLLPPSGLVDLEARERTVNGSLFTYEVFQQRSGLQFSWAVLLLPFMEQQNLYEQFDMTKSVFEQQGAPQSRSLPLLLCPSDDAQGRVFADDELTGGTELAKGNYAAYCTPYHLDLQQVYPGALIARGQPLRRITDGLSNTFLLSEVRTRDHVQDERGAWALPWTGASLLAYDMHHDSRTYGFDASFVALDDYDYQTQLPNTLGPNNDTLQICPELPEAQLEGMPCLDNAGWLSAAPRSLHAGGVNVAYLDGRVVFITDDIDAYVMAYSISTVDGQLNEGQTLRPSAE